MAKKKAEATTKAPTKPKKADFSKVSQSLEVVEFEYSKDSNAKKKGDVVKCSRNVAEILELKNLGKIK